MLVSMFTMCSFRAYHRRTLFRSEKSSGRRAAIILIPLDLHPLRLHLHRRMTTRGITPSRWPCTTWNNQFNPVSLTGLQLAMVLMRFVYRYLLLFKFRNWFRNLKNKIGNVRWSNLRYSIDILPNLPIWLVTGKNGIIVFWKQNYPLLTYSFRSARSLRQHKSMAFADLLRICWITCRATLTSLWTVQVLHTVVFLFFVLFII